MVSYSTSYLVRNPTQADVPTIHQLEQARWSRESGTEIIAESELTQWVASDSPFFLVVEKAGAVVGYYYGLQMNFSFADCEHLVQALHQHGYAALGHHPQGDSVFCASALISEPAAGAVLRQTFLEQLRDSNMKYYFGCSRLSGLDFYLTKRAPKPLPCSEYEAALWYTLRSMQLLHARTWDITPTLPLIKLPDIRRPDHVLAHYVKDSRFGLAQLVPDYMPDKKSRNYGALIVSDWPHVT